ncbi:hypothetical protein HN843_07030 [bacterium]|jgi:hypothetical protein|nr:hypothetical protein [bacterium]
MSTLLQNPIVMVILGILLVILFFSILKRLVRIALVIIAIAIVWFGYMHFIGGGISDDTMETIEQATEEVKDAIDELKPVVEDVVDDAMEKAKPEIEKVKDKVVDKIADEIKRND